MAKETQTLIAYFRHQDRRRHYYESEKGSWNEAAIEILEQQFSYSRESLQEMLELHEGNLEVALDMLAQLEAEMDGQLPASGQVTPYKALLTAFLFRISHWMCLVD